jgi:ABC-type dipeptide/oligopeptide/nickel transport system permease subunit
VRIATTTRRGLATLAVLALCGSCASPCRALASEFSAERSTKVGVAPTSLAPPLELSPRSTYKPTRATSLAHGPTWSHLLGTDREGADVFVRVARGARFTLLAAAIAAVASLGAGLAIGGTAGYVAPVWEHRVERIAQALDAFPPLLLAGLLAATGSTPPFLAAAIGAGAVHAVRVARLVRAGALDRALDDRTLASRGLGASRGQVLARSLLPHLRPTIVAATIDVLGTTLALEGALALLGSAPPGTNVGWGALLVEGIARPGNGWLAAATAIACTAAVLALHALGGRVERAARATDALAPGPEAR